MKVLITGAAGFIGKNLAVRLDELADFEVVTFSRASAVGDLSAAAASADAVVHLAGVNRPLSEDEFAKGNAAFCDGHADYVPRSLICDPKKVNAAILPFY